MKTAKRHPLDRVKSAIEPGHPDFDRLRRIRAAVVRRAGGLERLVASFPGIVREAIDYVVDPVRTARSTIADLDNVEKTFIGLKVEHMLRDFLDVPKGVRDLVVDGEDVDVKSTVRATWMIPEETYSESGACLLICVADDAGRCWLGLVLAKPAYLNKPNRDRKRSVSSLGRQNILWIVEGESFPDSHWVGLDMEVFRRLRTLHPGARRAALFFEKNLGKAIHRSVVESLLFDQKDPMKRLRNNGGARDLLREKGIVLLSGQYDRLRLERLGYDAVRLDEMIAVEDDA